MLVVRLIGLALAALGARLGASISGRSLSSPSPSPSLRPLFFLRQIRTGRDSVHAQNLSPTKISERPKSGLSWLAYAPLDALNASRFSRLRSAFASPRFEIWRPAKGLLPGSSRWRVTHHLETSLMSQGEGQGETGTDSEAQGPVGLGSQVDPVNSEELFKAAERGDRKRVAELVALGADDNRWGSNKTARWGSNETALHKAIIFNDVGAVRLLVEAGVDVNARTERGHCPLHYAASLYMENCTETIHILLDAGANVNVKTDEPEGAHLDTPLHFAAAFGITEVVELLVAAGAQVSAQNSDGITPLHRTAFPWGEAESRRHAAKVILDAGADINVLGGRLGGKTPLGWAVRWSNGAVEELLRERGAWALHSWQLERGE